MTAFLVAKPSVLLRQLAEGPATPSVSARVCFCVGAWRWLAWREGVAGRRGGWMYVRWGSRSFGANLLGEGRREVGCGSVCKQKQRRARLGGCVCGAVLFCGTGEGVRTRVGS